ncbi:MAG TPA: MarR family transcriptional regulator [Chloroflexota bacterium]|nr:MarR family transcriptional regulator [Chloroflexota bacterium]
MSSDLTSRRPLVDTVIGSLRALAAEIDHLDEIAAARLGVNRTDLRCLERLGATGATSPTVLAVALGLTTGGMTAVIDRLEQAGYARRRPDPRDRRKIIVEGTDQLAARQEEIFGALLRETRTLVASYSDAELELIRDFLERSRAVIQGPANPASS